MTGRDLLILTSIVSTGLMAGLFFGWAASVIPGTRLVDDRSYVSTMTSINVAIINPAFLVPFLATPAVLGLAAIAEFRAGNDRRATLLAGAAATYVVGVLAVTGGGNVPLNNALDAFPFDSATAEELAERRSAYEGPWNRWHTIRTAAAVASFAIASAALSTGDE